MRSQEETPLRTEKQSLPGSSHGRTFWKRTDLELQELRVIFIVGRGDIKSKGRHADEGGGTSLDLDYEGVYSVCSSETYMGLFCSVVKSLSRADFKNQS